MSSSSTRTAESWRQNRSPSGKRVKQRGQTFTRLVPRLHEQGAVAIVDRALAVGRLDVQQDELQADVELLRRRELDPAGDRDLERAGARVEVGNAELGEDHDRQ